MLEGCANITRIADPQQQCQLARSQCDLGSIIPYATLIFCQFAGLLARILALALLILLNFAAMGVAAFDYLSPNLTTIAEISGLSQSLMGVTVLAFGNGSVDVFGAIVAVSAGEGGMAFGEIMGGALFVCSIVIGSMAIVKPFEIELKYMLRDIFILATSVMYTMLIVTDGVITVTEALLGFGIYVAYAIFVVHQQWNRGGSGGSGGGSRMRNKDNRFPAVSSPPEIPRIEEPQPPFRSRSGSESSLNLDVPFTPLRPSLYKALGMSAEVQKRLEQISSRESSPQPAGAPESSAPGQRRLSAPDVAPSNLLSPHISLSSSKSYSASTSPSVMPKHYNKVSSKPAPSQNASSSKLELPKLHTNNLMVPPPQDISQGLSSRPLPSATGNQAYGPAELQVPHTAIEHTPPHYKDFSMQHLVEQLLEVREDHYRLAPVNSQMPSQIDSDPQSLRSFNSISTLDMGSTDEHWESHKENGEDTWWHYVFPCLQDWCQFGTIRKLFVLSTLPIVSLLTWSTPLASKSESRAHIIICSIGVPALFPFIVPKLTYSPLVAILQSALAVLGILYWGKLKRPLPSSLIVASVGFFMSLLWVILLATELVAMLGVLGEVCRVSETVLGLTIFALGDSLGDFVSNLTVARIGFPTMAISACLGGPIFTLLMGVSGSSLIYMLMNQRMTLEVSINRSLLFSGGGMILVLLTFVALVYKDSSKVTKRTGILLIAMYLAIVGGILLYGRSN